MIAHQAKRISGIQNRSDNRDPDRIPTQLIRSTISCSILRYVKNDSNLAQRRATFGGRVWDSADSSPVDVGFALVN